MSGSISEAGRGAGAATAIVGGAAVLPNTGGNMVASIILCVIIAAGVGIIATTLTRKLMVRK